MRSPKPAFNLRAALTEEVNSALWEFDNGDGRPKTVHRCRVRLKRARALARIGRACAPGLAQVFEDSASTAMRVLSEERDLCVLAETARLLAELSKRRTAAAFNAIADRFDAERTLMQHASPQATRTMLVDLAALAQVWPEASPRQIERGAKHIIRRARRARKAAKGSHTPELRHAWRKREKERFYAADILGASFPAKRRHALGEKLGHVLGLERDTLLVLDRLHLDPALAQTPDGARRAAAVLKKRQKQLGRRADALAARLHAGGG